MMTRTSNCLLPLVFGLVVVPLVPSTVESFERTKTCGTFSTSPCRSDETSKPIAWPVRCVKYHINEEGTADFGRTNGEIGPELQRLVETGLERWNAPNCSDFTMVNGGLTSRSEAQFRRGQGDENTNLLVWRDQQWPYISRTAFAVTRVTFTRSGKTRDADIQFNSDVYEFAHVDSSTSPSESEKVDFLNTLMHEIGHSLGLDHSDESEATMYGDANTGETKKRDLHQDDIDGLCAIYPAPNSPATCDDPEDFRPDPPSTADAGAAGADASGEPDALDDVSSRNRAPDAGTVEGTRARASSDREGCGCGTVESRRGEGGSPPWEMFVWGMVVAIGRAGKRTQATSSKRSP